MNIQRCASVNRHNLKYTVLYSFNTVTGFQSKVNLCYFVAIWVTVEKIAVFLYFATVNPSGSHQRNVKFINSSSIEVFLL